jgi:tetratricopeptide (TPR) repeat protein
MRSSEPWWSSPRAHAAFLALVCLGIYSNNFHHDFQLDDSHVLLTNPSVRSLANIPRYFTDPSTFTSLRANVDYRPVLQATYALNYRMGGYDTWWWHLTQILLHAVCAIGLYFLCRRILLASSSGAEDRRALRSVPLLAAVVFALHPTASGVVNYLSARSSLLTAAFLLPSILLYMAPHGEQRSARIPWLAALLYTLALFSKVEAVGCLAVYFLFEVWQTAIARGRVGNFFSDLRHALDRQTLRRLAPFLAVTVVYFIIRRQVMAPFQLGEASRPVGVSSWQYLLTQTVVWWEYVLKWFAPVRLVADQGNYPVYRSLLDGPVPLAIGAWLAIGAGLVAFWKERPYLTFLAFSALALLSPTSSVAPLAEMLNEHRPYLPLALLSLCWIIPLGGFAVGAAPRHRAGAGFSALGFALVLVGLGSLTWQRNRVFATERSYLEDVVAKAPSGRALNNYGLLFMREGNYERARELFEEAVKYTPYWSTVHINLGIVYRHLGDSLRARQHYDLGVQYDLYSGTALTWRAEDLLAQGRYREAARDFEAASPKSLERYRMCKGLATAYAGLGDVEKSFDYTRQCLDLDAAQTGTDIVAIAKPFFDSESLAPAGLAFFERLDARLPNTWWVHYNIGTLARRMGDTARGDAEYARAEALKKGN